MRELRLTKVTLSPLGCVQTICSLSCVKVSIAFPSAVRTRVSIGFECPDQMPSSFNRFCLGDGSSNRSNLDSNTHIRPSKTWAKIVKPGKITVSQFLSCAKLGGESGLHIYLKLTCASRKCMKLYKPALLIPHKFRSGIRHM